MTDQTPYPEDHETPFVESPAEKPTLAELFTPERAKKAYSAGLAAGILATGAAVPGVVADGAIDAPEVFLLIGAFVVPFVGAFFAAWLPTNATS